MAIPLKLIDKNSKTEKSIEYINSNEKLKKRQIENFFKDRTNEAIRISNYFETAMRLA